VQTLWQDLRYSLRTLRNSPGFTIVAVLTLALGIGANTAIFSLVDAVLFRALPYRDSGSLVWATNFVRSTGQYLVFADEYAGWQAQNNVFENIAAYTASTEYTLTGTAHPERLRGASVTESFLNVLGVTPQLGRNFIPEEDRPRGRKAVLLGDRLWRSSLGADRNVVGRLIALDDVPYTVIGVLPRDFEFPDNSPADMLVPLQLGASSMVISNGRVERVDILPLDVLARLRSGSSVAGTVAQLNTINERVFGSLPVEMARLLGEGQARVVMLHDHEVGNVRPALLVLLGAVGFVLLIACVNVANLELVRSTAREKAVAIRRALGAGPLRLARQLLTESAMVALIGGAAGLLLAAWAIGLIRHFAPQDIPHLQNARLDLPVLMFTLCVSLMTGVLFGLAPVLAASRSSVNDTLKKSGPHSGAGKGARRAHAALMVSEIALSFVLFVGACLLVKSFLQLTAVQPGFDPHGVLTAQVALPPDEYKDDSQQRAFFAKLVEKLQALPGVASAGATSSIPLRGEEMISTIQIEGQPLADFGVPNPPSARFNVVTPGCFQALRVPLIEGRLLDERDAPSAPYSVVVNQAFVRRYFVSEDPIGKRLESGLGPGSDAPHTWTIVGVIGDTKQLGLASEIIPEITASAFQWPRLNMTLVLHSSIDPRSLVRAVRMQVSDLAKNVPVYGVETMEEVLFGVAASQRFNAGAMSGFAGLAVLLAALGIYGVMSYAVSQRTHELGLRIALGADEVKILLMVVNQGLLIVAIGVGLGLVVSFPLTRLMTGLLFGVRPSDPGAFVLVAVVLVAIALVACWIPARRAMRVDPMVALRHE
jgi:predicted permease